jgi:hypothetical protein
MMKLHVFVDKEGEVVATGPAPDDSSSRRVEDGPLFAGFSPANGSAGDFRAFEIEVDDDFNLSRRNPDIEDFHGRLTGWSARVRIRGRSKSGVDGTRDLLPAGRRSRDST